MSIQSEKFALARAKNKKEQDKLIEVFDKKTNKNVIILKDKLRKISNDPKFTNQDRYEILKQIQKLESGKLDLGKLKFEKKPSEKAKGVVRSPHKKHKGGLIKKPKLAERGY